MKRWWLITYLFGVMMTVEGQETVDKLVWWTEARFGLFVHWGLYSQTAGDWKGKPTRGGEHFMLYEQIPLAEYAKIADTFNPTGFSAEEWVMAAKDAGMKYVVITTKHHDGFAMFDSPSSDYNIVKKTPWGRDPLKELAEACRKHGLKLGFYYSLGRDWEDPDVPTNWPTKAGRSNYWDYPDEDRKDLNKYIGRKVKPQLRELLTQYGQIDVIWFDTPELFSKEQSAAIREFILDIQPNCIINNRIGNNLGDYTVVEQSLAGSAKGNWESCITMSKNWGYNRHDKAWKSSTVLIRNIIETASQGGNLLLNVGTKGDGRFPKESIERLAAIGRWMKVNGEAIYGTTAWMVPGEGNLELEKEDLGMGEKMTSKDAENDATSKEVISDIRFTTKDDEVYIFLRNPDSDAISVKSMKKNTIKIEKISMLGNDENVVWEQHSDALKFHIPAGIQPDVPVYVFKVKTR